MDLMREMTEEEHNVPMADILDEMYKNGKLLQCGIWEKHTTFPSQYFETPNGRNYSY